MPVREEFAPKVVVRAGPGILTEKGLRKNEIIRANLGSVLDHRIFHNETVLSKFRPGRNVRRWADKRSWPKAHFEGFFEHFLARKILAPAFERHKNVVFLRWKTIRQGLERRDRKIDHPGFRNEPLVGCERHDLKPGVVLEIMGKHLREGPDSENDDLRFHAVFLSESGSPPMTRM